MSDLYMIQPAFSLACCW